jgi:hypothetical protein
VTIYCSGEWRVFCKHRGVERFYVVGPKGLHGMTNPATLAPHMQRFAVVAKTDRDPYFYVGWFARRELKGGGRISVSQNGKPGEIPKSSGRMTVVVQGKVRQARGGSLGPGAALRSGR